MQSLLTVHDVAEKLKVHPKTLYNWRRQKAMHFPDPALPPRCGLRWRPEDIETWLSWLSERCEAERQGLDADLVEPPVYGRERQTVPPEED